MNELIKIEAEIDRLLTTNTGDCSAPYWLKNGFDCPVWEIDFNGVESMTVDFRTQLEDGSSLVDAKNFQLILTFKAWIVQVYDQPQKVLLSSRAMSTYRRVSVALKLIDYFLIRSDRFQLGGAGLALVTTNDIKTLFRCIGRSNKTALTIYDWPNQLRNYLHQKASTLDYEEVLRSQPLLRRFDISSSEFMVAQCKDEAQLFRAVLWKEGLLSEKKERMCSQRSQFTFRSQPIVRQLYSDTLRGIFNYPKPPEFEIGKITGLGREFDPAPVKFNGQRPMNDREISRYGRTLIQFNICRIGFTGVLTSDIEKATTLALDSSTSVGRFATLPHSAVMFAIKNSVEFYLRYGVALLRTFLAVCDHKIANRRSHKDSSVLAAQKNEPAEVLKDFDLQVWRIPNESLGVGDSDVASDYFKDLRNGRGLWELLQVLFGGIHIMLAALTARRIAELTELKVDRCLDDSESFLIFENRKSGSGELREKELRPIPPIAVRMIQTTRWFQGEMIKRDLLDDYRCPMASPLQTALTLKNFKPNASPLHIDTFCDYFEMPRNAAGERYYIRNHQLRRFFAMAFFWSGTPSGEDTLSWFLGHTDPEHLYHYITEEVPGEALTSVKASVAAELAVDDTSLKTELTALLRKRFGVSKFSLLSAEELAFYIADLIEEGQVKVEPHFFEDMNGKKYQICVKVIDMGGRTS